MCSKLSDRLLQVKRMKKHSKVSDEKRQLNKTPDVCKKGEGGGNGNTTDPVTGRKVSTREKKR